VFALKANTGALLWSYATGGGIQASFAVERGVIYVASADTYLYALDATTGVKLWDYLSGGFYTSSPTAAN
jgi:eukaryotic-like serine/threonine-protein kinase